VTSAVTRDGLFGKTPGAKQPFSFSGDLSRILPFSHIPSTRIETQGDMEVCLIEEQQFPSGSRIPKRPRADEDQGDGAEMPTEKCRKHPSLYLEDGNVVLRCEE